MKQTRLDGKAISEKLKELKHWQLAEDGKAISRAFAFRNFAEAFSFMTECALSAEKLNHHPEWFNVYRRVEVKLTTHDIDGLSELDFRLANLMDRAAASRS